MLAQLVGRWFLVFSLEEIKIPPRGECAICCGLPNYTEENSEMNPVSIFYKNAYSGLKNITINLRRTLGKG